MESNRFHPASYRFSFYPSFLTAGLMKGSVPEALTFIRRASLKVPDPCIDEANIFASYTPAGTWAFQYPEYSFPEDLTRFTVPTSLPAPSLMAALACQQNLANGRS